MTAAVYVDRASALATAIVIVPLVRRGTGRGARRWAVALADWSRPNGRNGGPALRTFGPLDGLPSKAEARAAAAAVWAIVALVSFVGARRQHTCDADCAPFIVEGVCGVCGVAHGGGACAHCGGHGFHRDDCAHVDDGPFWPSP